MFESILRCAGVRDSFSRTSASTCASPSGLIETSSEPAPEAKGGPTTSAARRTARADAARPESFILFPCLPLAHRERVGAAHWANANAVAIHPLSGWGAPGRVMGDTFQVFHWPSNSLSWRGFGSEPEGG